MVARFKAVKANWSQLYRNYVKASAHQEEAIALADEKGALFWKALATAFRGSVFALAGDASKAIQVATSGITMYRSTGARALLPLSLSYSFRLCGTEPVG
jgi:hypothetical protein